VSELNVMDTTVPGVLESLKKGEWLVPEFQRDFVWSIEQVSALVQSILEARPIGMVTLWEQSDQGQIPIERISIPDYDTDLKKTALRYFGADLRANKRFALLDGRQRCTAIAMAFGGFRALHGLYKYSGRYYLDVTESDPRKRVTFYKESDVKKLNLDRDSSCFSRGLFPLASNNDGEPVLSQWMRYLQALEKPEHYKGGEKPTREGLAQRNKILQEAFQGIVETKLAVYIVPEKYLLGDICEIFETLNTTGTKVSTVDLIHSWLYNDTFGKARPFLLRDWINDLGAKDGAIGWASTDDRPELTAQIVTACYVALESKPKPRQVGKGKLSQITSVKAGDLLATPTDHWEHVWQHDELFAQYMGDAQKSICGGFFPFTSCPYPVSLAIYVGLRWHSRFDEAKTHPWAIDELDALYRAFFWRNALTRRYDQGFLTQIGTDLDRLKELLMRRARYKSSGEWAKAIELSLADLIACPTPSKDELVDLLTSGRLDGAIQKAVLLPMLGAVRHDIVDSSISLAYPSTIPVELHHIFPREWCRSHKSGPLATVLDEEKAGRDYANSAANLMPLSRTSNNAWKQKFPASFLAEKAISFEQNKKKLRPIFVDEKGFRLLEKGERNIEGFWAHRADLMAEDLVDRTKLIL